jgi:hypothetical protein
MRRACVLLSGGTQPAKNAVVIRSTQELAKYPFALSRRIFVPKEEHHCIGVRRFKLEPQRRSRVAGTVKR